MTYRSKARLAAWAIGLISIAPLAHAQDADQQRRRPMQERRNEGGIPPWQRGEFARGNAPTTEPANDAAIRDFMKQYSPKRWEKYESDIPEEHKDRIYRAMSMKFMQLERMKDEPELYAILIKRLPIEDEIFSLGLDLSRGGSKNRDETRAKLTQGVRALLTNRIEERRVRLKVWQQRVEVESAKLKNDEASLEREIDSTVSSIESTSKWPSMEGLLLPLPRERRQQKDRPTTNPSTASVKVGEARQQ